MLDPTKIAYYFGLFKNLELTDFSAIFKLVHIRRLKAGEHFIKEGDYYRKITYIQKGIIRAYAIQENGAEITTLIRWEDQFISSHDSILLHQASRFYYQAIEATILLEVDYDIAQNFLAKNPKLEAGRRHFLTKMLAESLARVESFILLTPEERYLQFIAEKPDIVQRVPSKYIATLLGITPVSLSRIRKRISNNKRN